MKYERTELYKGYQISGKASPTSTRWQSLVTLRRPKCQTEAMGVSPACATAQDAIEQALDAARLMIDGAGFALQADSDILLKSRPL